MIFAMGFIAILGWLVAIHQHGEATEYQIKYVHAQASIAALVDGLGPNEVLRKTKMEGDPCPICGRDDEHTHDFEDATL